MPVCDTCGNDYDKVLRVTDAGGGSYVFDSIECLAHRLAPLCDHCGCRILGHGIEGDGKIACCAYCARELGVAATLDLV
jgi:hypothetical protein